MPTLTLSGITTANLTDTVGRQHLHGQRLDGERVAHRQRDRADTVTASKTPAHLDQLLLSSTDGMSLGLSGITTANLTYTSGGKLHRHRLDRGRLADRHRHGHRSADAAMATSP